MPYFICFYNQRQHKFQVGIKGENDFAFPPLLIHLNYCIITLTRGCGGIGRHARFRFLCQKHAGSTPVTRTRKEPTFVYDKCGFFSTKSVLTDGINPTLVGRNHFVMKSRFAGRDRTDLISSALADFIRACSDFIALARFH